MYTLYTCTRNYIIYIINLYFIRVPIILIKICFSFSCKNGKTILLYVVTTITTITITPTPLHSPTTPCSPTHPYTYIQYAQGHNWSGEQFYNGRLIAHLL